MVPAPPAVLHPRETIKWDRANKCFTCRGRKLRGVHPVIRNLVCPEYSYAKATLGRRGFIHRTKGSRTPHSAATGKRRGKYVDKEITKWCRAWLKADDAESTPAQRGALTRVTRGLSKSAFKLVQYLKAQNLEPVDTQINVGNPVLRVGTAVDLLCRHHMTNKFVVIEVKCGFETYYQKHTATPMNFPFGSQNDCVANQHQIQLGLTVALFQHTYPAANIDDAFVLVSRGHGVDAYRLKSWVTKNTKQFAGVLARTVGMTQKKHAKQRRSSKKQ